MGLFGNKKREGISDAELEAKVNFVCERLDRIENVANKAAMWSDALRLLRIASTELAKELDDFVQAESSQGACIGMDKGSLDDAISALGLTTRQFERTTDAAMYAFRARVSGPLQVLSGYKDGIRTKVQERNSLAAEVASIKRKTKGGKGKRPQKLDDAEASLNSCTALLETEIRRMNSSWPLLVRDQVAEAVRIESSLLSGKLAQANAEDAPSVPLPPKHTTGAKINRWVAMGGPSSARLAQYNNNVTAEWLEAVVAESPPEATGFDPPIAKAPISPTDDGCPPNEDGDAQSMGHFVPTDSAGTKSLDELVDFSLMPILLRSGVSFLDAQRFGDHVKKSGVAVEAIEEEVLGSAELLLAALTEGVAAFDVVALDSTINEDHIAKIESDAYFEQDKRGRKSHLTYFRDDGVKGDLKSADVVSKGFAAVHAAAAKDKAAAQQQQ